MAKETPCSFRMLVIYEIYVRKHGPNITFAEAEADLLRIRSMGVDVIWYKNRFFHLIEKAHSLGLKVMIDGVYNHTSHDSILVKEHREWFHQGADGWPITTVPEWADVIELKHLESSRKSEKADTLNMVRLWEHIKRSNPFQSIPSRQQPVGVAGQRGWITGYIGDQFRLHFNDFIQGEFIHPRSGWVHHDHIGFEIQSWYHVFNCTDIQFNVVKLIQVNCKIFTC